MPISVYVRSKSSNSARVEFCFCLIYFRCSVERMRNFGTCLTTVQLSLELTQSGNLCHFGVRWLMSMMYNLHSGCLISRVAKPSFTSSLPMRKPVSGAKSQSTLSPVFMLRMWPVLRSTTSNHPVSRGESSVALEDGRASMNSSRRPEALNRGYAPGPRSRSCLPLLSKTHRCHRVSDNTTAQRPLGETDDRCVSSRYIRSILPRIVTVPDKCPMEY